MPSFKYLFKEKFSPIFFFVSVIKKSNVFTKFRQPILVNQLSFVKAGKSKQFNYLLIYFKPGHKDSLKSIFQFESEKLNYTRGNLVPMQDRV